ncbi:MAG: aminodeoxychorismate synthase component I [Elusimicrobiales bacterium]|jgi:para-aminobenzoate synthetase component 1
MKTKPHVREIPYAEPSVLAVRLAGRKSMMLLDSSMRHPRLGRYSYLSCDPAASLIVRDGMTVWNGEAQSGPALRVLDRVLAENRTAGLSGLPPFQGGFMGYIGYEFGRTLEPGARIAESPGLCPELVLNFYDAVAAFDHEHGRAFIIAAGFHGLKAAERADGLEQLLSGPGPVLPRESRVGGWKSNFTRAGYEASVKRTVDYILAGDIFQANISQCFSARLPEKFDALAFYLRLRALNPAPFSAFMEHEGLALASSSPERFLSFDGRLAEARPIKGTRRRDPDPGRDAALMEELLTSRKDRAENVMIVDILRNDLSRVCDPGSVSVPVLCGLESYAAVHHLTSVVTGRLSENRTRGDLLGACFPGGSITGAPKIRAMEVIAEIEGRPRGVYCGSIGFFGANGTMDLNIAIRSAMFAGGAASFQGGGGITAGSDPAAEYDETMAKVERLMEAFGDR